MATSFKKFWGKDKSRGIAPVPSCFEIRAVPRCGPVPATPARIVQGRFDKDYYSCRYGDSRSLHSRSCRAAGHS